MNSALIKRLRKIATLEAEDYGAEPQDHLSWQAADVIERQAAQIEMMREALIACHNDLELRMTLSKDDSLNISNSVLDKMLDAIDTPPDQALEQFATLKGLK